MLPISYFKPPPPDPELIRLEQNFNRMLEESNRPKGLPGILGLNKKYDKQRYETTPKGFVYEHG